MMYLGKRSQAKNIRDTVEKWCVENIETMGVAVITRVSDYPTSRVVDVQPLTCNVDKDGVITVPAFIQNCPVLLQGNLDGYISFPPEVGCKVFVGYPKRSIEEFVYTSNTDVYEPVDGILFGSSQAVVLGYIGQANQELEVSPTDFEIRFKDAKLSFKPDSSIRLANQQFAMEADASGSLGMGNSGSSIALNVGGTWNITGSGAGTLNGATVTADGNLITASGTDLNQLKADFDALLAAYIEHGVGAPNHPPPTP